MQAKRENPILFQGDLNQSNYFEGWYYKQVSADQKTSLSFIPGISLNEQDEHSFIQYIVVRTDNSGQTETLTGYVRYPLESFAVQDSPFAVRIGTSMFTERMMEIDLVEDGLHFKGKLEFGPLEAIETSWLHPNIMGVFAYVPKMTCYHGVISMNHSLEGQLMMNEASIQFTGGKGYIEKDWGTSFPKRYIWLQSNHFDQTETSLFFSLAHIPFYFTEFEGFICNVMHAGKEYRFATYNLSRCKLIDLTADQITLRLENRSACLDITAKVAEGAELIAPVQGVMQRAIKEGISGVLSIRLENKETGEVYQGTGRNAGVEVVDYKLTR